jgi:ABC-type transport system involved in multi-copper enzyme maturation permease subunit
MRVNSALLAAELLKTRKRWLPYVLLLVMLIGAGIQIWLAGYTSWRGATDDPQYRGDALRSFVLPYSLTTLLETGQSWGSIIVGVLVASVVATEYSWGTVRQAVLRGQTRAEYLTIKLLGIAGVATVSLLFALGVGLLFSVMASAVADQPISFAAPGGPSAFEALLMIVRAGYCILPYALLAFCLTVVGRSTALGVAGTLMFVFGEAILTGILVSIGGVAGAIAAFLPGHNVNAIMALNRIGSGSFNTPALRDTGLARSELPDPTVAALVLAIYCVAFLAISYVVFQKRDMTAGAGAS